MDCENLPAGPYRIPEATTNPIGAIVMNYKLFKNIEFDDRLWDAKHWSRGMRTAKEILMICKSYEMAKKCIEEIGGKYDKDDLSWNLETVARNAHEWFAKRERRNDKQKRERFLNALNEQRSNNALKIEGKSLTAGEMLNAIGNLEVIRNSDGIKDGSGNSENGGVGKRIQPPGMEEKAS